MSIWKRGQTIACSVFARSLTAGTSGLIDLTHCAVCHNICLAVLLSVTDCVSVWHKIAVKLGMELTISLWFRWQKCSRIGEEQNSEVLGFLLL